MSVELTDLIPEAFGSGIKSMKQHFIFYNNFIFLIMNIFIKHVYITCLNVDETDLIPEAFGSGIKSMKQHLIFHTNVIF
jgi:hypothetical protein